MMRGHGAAAGGCREERIEPPAPDRVTRMVRSALHTAEETWFEVISAWLDPQVRARVLGLVQADQADQADEGDVLAEPAWSDRLTAADRRGLTPLFWSHVRPYGEVRLDLESRLAIRTTGGLGGS